MEVRYEELKWNAAPLYAMSAPSLESNDAENSELLPIPASIASFSQQQQQQEEGEATPNDKHIHTLPMSAETTALLIVDVQPEYWSNCPAVRNDFPDFPSHLASTIETCRQRNAKIIWVRADYRYSHSPWLVQFERIHKGTKLAQLPCDPTFAECAWEDFATPHAGHDLIITKTSWSSTTKTTLTDYLRSAGIDTVLVCGLITSVCVQHSAFGIFEAGYRTLLVTDACADRSRARHDAALALYGDYMYELVTSEKLKSPTRGLIPAAHGRLVVVRDDSFPTMVQSFSKQLHTSEEEDTDSMSTM
jgi:nicotinamidase-related amidase